ncbi:hypothetical protein ACROYT_G033489 [Oculina patagonica]
MPTQDGQDVEEVSSFIYLGATVQREGGSHEDIKRRLSIARRVYATLNPVWRSKMNSKHTKLKILKSCVTSVLLYGAEMWRISSTDIEQLDVFHQKCLRRILGIFWPHTISNCDLYERTKQRPISETVKVRESEEDPRFRGKELWKVSVKTWAGLAGMRWNSEQKTVKDRGRFWIALCSSQRSE